LEKIIGDYQGVKTPAFKDNLRTDLYKSLTGNLGVHVTLHNQRNEIQARISKQNSSKQKLEDFSHEVQYYEKEIKSEMEEDCNKQSLINFVKDLQEREYLDNVMKKERKSSLNKINLRRDTLKFKSRELKGMVLWKDWVLIKRKQKQKTKEM